ncbi:MAG: histidine kinase, partial [Nitrospirae bacterium]|nr:histidine kinase [Nitrospirota bacterium]
MGEFAAGLAHDIKNPLAGIKASVEALLGEQCISEEDRADIIRAADEIKRIEVLLKNLLNFAKPSKPQPIALDINDFIDKTIVFSLKHPSVAANTSTTINVIRDFDRKLPEIMADPMQLQQVFLNLILNAIDVMPNGGTLAVKTSHDKDAKTIHIDISDTGGGIDGSMADQIFQPFFTTKTKGTGLGLAISKRLTEQHGGGICIENRPGIGVIFHVSLPVRKERI